MSKEIHIRPASILDLDTIIEFTSMIATHENGIFDAEGRKEQLSKHLFSSHPRLHCILASIDSVVCGYATYSTEFSVF